jgi:hypothetical protein
MQPTLLVDMRAVVLPRGCYLAMYVWALIVNAGSGCGCGAAVLVVVFILDRDGYRIRKPRRNRW